MGLREGPQVSRGDRYYRNWLAEHGLNMQAVFELATLSEEVRASLALAGVGAGFRQLLLFGSGGREFWHALARAGMGDEHPVDRFAVACVNHYMQQAHPGRRYQLLYPGTAQVPLQSLGRLAGWHHPSPLMVGINARWGLWFAYRVALLADTGLTATVPWTEPSPCAGCSTAPCINSCPAGALAEGRLRLESCLAYRRRPGSLCRTTCLAREACPISSRHRYSDEQIRYHYGRSLQLILSHQPGAIGGESA